MRKRELCYVCKEQSRREKWVSENGLKVEATAVVRPSKFFFVTTNDYLEHDGPIFDPNNPPEYTDFRNAVSCCNEHVEDLKRVFTDEEIREVSYEEWVVHSIMVT